VLGALAAPNSRPVAPERSTSRSSMLSAPASIPTAPSRPSRRCWPPPSLAAAAPGRSPPASRGAATTTRPAAAPRATPDSGRRSSPRPGSTPAMLASGRCPLTRPSWSLSKTQSASSAGHLPTNTPNNINTLRCIQADLRLCSNAAGHRLTVAELPSWPCRFDPGHPLIAEPQVGSAVLDERPAPGDLVTAYQGTVPERSVKVPVGPSGPTSAMATIASVPSVTVWVPWLPLRSVAV